MLDTSSGKTIVVNCVEVYGRRRTIDSHRESFRTKRGTFQALYRRKLQNTLMYGQQASATLMGRSWFWEPRRSTRWLHPVYAWINPVILKSGQQLHRSVWKRLLSPSIPSSSSRNLRGMLLPHWRSTKIPKQYPHMTASFNYDNYERVFTINQHISDAVHSMNRRMI